MHCRFPNEYHALWMNVIPLILLYSEIAQSVTLETIETLAFNNLLNLSEM